MTRRLTAFLIVAALGLPARAFGQLAHRCPAQAPVFGTSCCHTARDGGTPAELDRDDCCGAESRRASPLAAAPQPASPPLPDLAAVAVLPPRGAAALDPRPRVLAPAGAPAPPPLHGRGIYLEVCSLLI